MELVVIGVAFFTPLVLVGVRTRRVSGRYEAFLASETGVRRLALEDLPSTMPWGWYGPWREYVARREAIDARVARGDFGPEGQRLLAAERANLRIAVVGTFAGFPMVFVVTWIMRLLAER